MHEQQPRFGKNSDTDPQEKSIKNKQNRSKFLFKDKAFNHNNDSNDDDIKIYEPKGRKPPGEVHDVVLQ